MWPTLEGGNGCHDLKRTNGCGHDLNGEKDGATTCRGGGGAVTYC